MTLGRDTPLGLLREFAVDAIKLDRRFFLDIEDQRAREVITSVVQLARKIGLQVVAEGIETAEQLDFLRDVECDLVQGYIYSKPLPIKDFERWAGENGWRP